MQGGTFHNQAVLRAFEKIAGADVTCPDISGVMGAFGAALLARRHYRGQETAMLPLDEILNLTYSDEDRALRRLRKPLHADGQHLRRRAAAHHGQPLRKAASAPREERHRAPNMLAYKRQRLFAYPPLAARTPPRAACWASRGC